MALGSIIGIIFLVFIAICGYYAFQSYTKKRKKKATLGVVGVAVLALLMGIISPSFHTVEAGEVAVVKHLGEARTVRTAGTYFDFWVTEKYEVYDAKVQNLEVKTQAYSKDAQTMSIAMTVQYQIDASKAITIANQYGSIEVLANRIESVAT